MHMYAECGHICKAQSLLEKAPFSQCRPGLLGLKDVLKMGKLSMVGFLHDELSRPRLVEHHIVMCGAFNAHVCHVWWN